MIASSLKLLRKVLHSLFQTPRLLLYPKHGIRLPLDCLTEPPHPFQAVEILNESPSAAKHLVYNTIAQEGPCMFKRCNDSGRNARRKSLDSVGNIGSGPRRI